MRLEFGSIGELLITLLIAFRSNFEDVRTHFQFEKIIIKKNQILNILKGLRCPELNRSQNMRATRFTKCKKFSVESSPNRPASQIVLSHEKLVTSLNTRFMVFMKVLSVFGYFFSFVSDRYFLIDGIAGDGCDYA